LFGVLFAAAVILADAPPARVSPAAGAALAGCAAALALLTRSIGVAAGAGRVVFLLATSRAPRHPTPAAAAPVPLAAPAWRLRLRLAVLVLAAVMVAGYGVIEVRGFAGRWWGTAAHQISANFAELLPWLDTLPPRAVLAIDDEALVWLYTGRASVPLSVYGY